MNTDEKLDQRNVIDTVENDTSNLIPEVTRSSFDKSAASATPSELPFNSDASDKNGKKPTKPSLATRKYYQSIRKNRLPASASGRWRWAIRKIMRLNRSRVLKIGFTRTRVEKGLSIAERLERLEFEMFRIPLALEDYLRQQSEKDSARASDQFRTLDLQVKSQQVVCYSFNIAILIPISIDISVDYNIPP